MTGEQVPGTPGLSSIDGSLPSGDKVEGTSGPGASSLPDTKGTKETPPAHVSFHVHYHYHEVGQRYLLPPGCSHSDAGATASEQTQAEQLRLHSSNKDHSTVMIAPGETVRLLHSCPSSTSVEYRTSTSDNGTTSVREAGEPADNNSSNPPRFCRFCLEEESTAESDPSNPLIAPCLCSGSARYVHRKCLQQWREASATAFYKCNVCSYDYQFRRLDCAWLLRSPLTAPVLIVLLLFTCCAIFGFLPTVQPADGNFGIWLLNGFVLVGTVGFGITIAEIFSFRRAMYMIAGIESRWLRCLAVVAFQWTAIIVMVACLTAAGLYRYGHIILALAGINKLSLGPIYDYIKAACEKAVVRIEMTSSQMQVVEVGEQQRLAAQRQSPQQPQQQPLQQPQQQPQQQSWQQPQPQPYTQQQHQHQQLWQQVSLTESPQDEVMHECLSSEHSNAASESLPLLPDAPQQHAKDASDPNA